MIRHITTLVLAALLVVIGLTAGWFAAHQGDSAASSGEAEAGGSDALDPRTLKNLGVVVGTAKLSDYVRTTAVQAVVVDRPLNTQPLTAPLGGIVTSIEVRAGGVVKAGVPVICVVREPIPRPALELTSELLTPVSENLHESIAQLRTARQILEIANAELARVRKFTEKMGGDEGELPLLPRKVMIDLEYDVARAEQDARNARRELERHGLGADEIEAVAAGALPPSNLRLWRLALTNNGLWGKTEDAIFQALPEGVRSRPWAVAAIGELAAAGLSSSELAKALTETPGLREHFVEAASLLLQGSSVPRLVLLAERGAFEPCMKIPAPQDAEEGLTWDVAEILVRPGQRVESGEPLVLLHDARRMWLRLEPVGEEIRAVLSALETGSPVGAVPLLAGSGPELANLRVDRLDTRSALEARGAVAFVMCDNETVPAPGGESRTWRLRVGLRYLVRVPAERLEQRFVLPSGAVTEVGLERVVFLEDGETFRSMPVHVEYEDDEVVVVANDGSLFAGDRVVTSGAFALGLALQTESGSADPHAGHGHG